MLLTQHVQGLKPFGCEATNVTKMLQEYLVEPTSTKIWESGLFVHGIEIA